MDIRKHKAASILIIILLSLLALSGVSAAGDNPKVYFATSLKQLPPGSEFTVRVLTDTTKPINAIDIEVNYSRDTLELASVNSSKSFIDFWRGLPQSPSTGGVINLEGGSIDPFSGNGGEIITLKFSAKKEGQANLSFTKVNLYYADGKGTRAQTESARSLNISVIEGAKVEIVALENGEAEDRTPPIIETAKVASSPIDKSRLAVFHAVDSDSGIKNTEIRFRQWFFWGDWQVATNPVRLPSTAWAFQVKAYDNAGNAAEKTVYVPQAGLNIFLPFLLPLLIAIILVGILRKRKNSANKV